MTDSMTRRAVLGAGLLMPLAGVARAASLTPTPAQTEGPFYPTRLPLDVDNDLVVLRGAEAQALGTVAHVSGRVLDTAGRPIAEARVEIWQCDHQGIYDHPREANLERRDRAFQGFGRMLTAADGGYRFRTIRPVPYTGRTPHIHVKVFAPDGRRLTTQMYLAGDPGNERDGLYRGIPPRLRERVLLKLEPANGLEPGAQAGSLDLVLG